MDERRWTDVNASDPGIALLALLAWLALALLVGRRVVGRLRRDAARRDG